MVDVRIECQREPHVHVREQHLHRSESRQFVGR
jgi:hypothetical protein